MSGKVSEVRKVVEASVAELHSKFADQDQLGQGPNQQPAVLTRKHDRHMGAPLCAFSADRGFADGSARREALCRNVLAAEVRSKTAGQDEFLNE